MHLNLLCVLAWRNLWRNHRRTLIMLSAITIGVWAMIFMTALMRGMVDQMVENGLNTFTGHIQIHHENFLDDPSINNSMRKPSAELQQELNQSVAWTTRVRVPAVVNSERESRGVVLMGIDSEKEKHLSFLAQSIVEGRYLRGEKDKGVLIGKKLAETLETELGKRIVLMSQDPDNNIVDIGVRIVGIYKADISATEEQFIFLSQPYTQNFLGLGDNIGEIETREEDFRHLENRKTALKKTLKESQQIKDWSQLNTLLSAMLGVMDGFVFIWMLVVFIALSFGLVNTLIMAVFERTREFGLMLSLGMKPRFILLQVLLESLFLLAIGLSLGTGLAWLAIQPMESGVDISVVAEGMATMGMGAVLYPSLNSSDMLMANSIVISLGLIASLFPAYKASRLKPVEAMTVT